MDCRDGDKDEVELRDAKVEAFEIVMDWVHLEKLLARLTNPKRALTNGH